MTGCVDHLNFTGETCPDCGLAVDQYGNTEDDFTHCCWPDCGCDGSRLCMAGEASEGAQSGNAEGMWNGNSPEKRRARMHLYATAIKEGKGK